jgi:hypothetical protein
MTMISSFLAHTPQEKHLSLEVTNYHLIFNLNGVLVVTSENKTKTPSLKEFLFACVKKFMVYIWSLVMKIVFFKWLDIIADKTSIHLPFYRIVDQSFALKKIIFCSKSRTSQFSIKTFSIYLFSFLI